MDKTSRWFIKADLTPYEEKYIAIVEEKVVGAGEDPEVLYQKAKEKYPHKEIILWKVPSRENFIF